MYTGISVGRWSTMKQRSTTFKEYEDHVYTFNHAHREQITTNKLDTRIQECIMINSTFQHALFTSTSQQSKNLTEYQWLWQKSNRYGPYGMVSHINYQSVASLCIRLSSSATSVPETSVDLRPTIFVTTL